MKNYAGLISRLHGTPLLMNENKLRVLTEAITVPLMLGNAANIERAESGSNATISEHAEIFSKEGRKVFIISVFDSLVSKSISAASGMTSYQAITAGIDEAIVRGATDIGFYMDTPGGEPSVFGLSEKIRSLPDRGINTFSFCDQACSAGYAIAAATQKIYLTSVGSIGSIAAIAVHAEISEKAEKDGVTYTVMRSKSAKALGDPYSKLSADAKEFYTSMLETLDTEFNNDVVKSRPKLTLAKVTDLAGTSLIGHLAVTAGLADAIAPNLENALSLFLEDSKTLTLTKPVGVTMSTPEDIAALAEANATIATLNQKVSTLEAALASNKEISEESVAAEAERVSTILTTAQTLHLDLATAAKYTDAKYSADIAKEILTDLAASADAQAGLDVSGSGAAPEEEGAAPGLRGAYKTATGI